MEGVKLVESYEQRFVQVLQRNYQGRDLATDGDVLPEDVDDPIFALFYSRLFSRIELPDGREIESESEPYDYSERHFWGGEMIQPDPDTISELKAGFHGQLGKSWENNRKLQLVMFTFKCASCDELHELYLPFVPGDVMHAVDDMSGC